MSKLGYLFVAAATVLVAGCSTTYDQRAATDFIPAAEGGWTYKTYADVTTPIEGQAGEAYRMSMLEVWLSQNGLCPHGYRAENKRFVQRSGVIYDVYYDVRCT